MGPVPLPPTPPEPQPLDPPSRALVRTPTPQGILQKTSFFFFWYVLETPKIRRKLQNLLRPWGPCPYHLPPRHRSPWTPPPSPSLGPRSLLFDPAPTPLPTLSCNQGPWFTALSTRPAPVGTPPPHRASLQKTSFLLFLYASCEICFVPGDRAPTTYPPGTKAPGPPLPSPCTPPHPTGYPSKKIIFLLFIRNMTQVAKFAPSLGPVPLPPTPPAPKPLDPPRAPA